MRCRILMAMALLASIVAAQMPGPVPAAELQARRARLCERIGEGVALIPGARKNPSYAEFRQNHRFYWLTGLEKPDSFLVVVGKTKKTILFTPREEYGSAWEGESVSGDAAIIARGAADEVRHDALLDEKLLREIVGMAGGRKPVLFMPLKPAERGLIVADAVEPWYDRFSKKRNPLDYEVSRETRLRALIAKAMPKLEVEDISSYLRRERVRKSDYEVEMIATATRISCESMSEIIRATRPETYEYEVGALFEYGCKRRGAQGLGYAAIVGSGPNTCLPHYTRKTRLMKDGDLVVVDAACSYGYYVSDVTRTFPVGGKFTKEQREVYEAVLAAQQAAIDACKPGVQFMTLNRIASKVIRDRGYGAYILHGLGHHVGMSVHDPGGYFFKLEPGQILTIEPGIYIPEKEIGVRIEDVVLVTEDGCRILSTQVPRTVEGIEALMAGGAK